MEEIEASNTVTIRIPDAESQEKFENQRFILIWISNGLAI